MTTPFRVLSKCLEYSQTCNAIVHAAVVSFISDQDGREKAVAYLEKNVSS